jgi:hypothetical protein
MWLIDMGRHGFESEGTTAQVQTTSRLLGQHGRIDEE